MKVAENVVDFDEHRSAEQAAKDLIPVLSEDHVALEFVDRNLGLVRFDSTNRKWYVWAGNRWQQDRTAVASSWTRSLVRALASDQSPADRRRLGSRKFCDGVEGFARTDQRVAVTHEHWDRNIEALGTPSGIVDLRTGELFDPEPNEFITRSVAVDPDISIDCLRFRRFLDQITGHDPALKKFLQQWAGYCLTGETREQKLVFIHGPGGTGKSTFATTLLKIMADYGGAAAMETFTDSRFEQHPEQVARLDGMRMVVASETEAGHKWRENRIKNMTGGDPITAHFMRKNSFTYQPQFKLTFLGNCAPAISNLDSAIQRRFLIIPFNCKPAEPDLRLDEMLAKEWPGILRWMILGAVDWHANGLIVPKAISEATTEYFDSQDAMGQWLSEACDVDPRNELLMEKSKLLFESWSTFAKAQGVPPGDQRQLNTNLRARSIETKQIKALGTSGCRGIRLKIQSHWQDDRS
jgi:putative DNA primase/helicase